MPNNALYDQKLEHFGLVEEPFTISPNPRFLFLTHQHKSAVSKSIYSIERRNGLNVVSGEVGTGKTTIARYLYHHFHDDEHYQVAMIIAPDLKTDSALLRAVMGEYGVPTKRSHALSLEAFQNYALDCFASQKNLVLIIDEAQQMTKPMLELIRVMLNFESDSEKFMQVVLLGQSELADRLDMPRYAAIKDRVSVFCTLDALTEADTIEMINFRWTAASGHDAPFEDTALQAIFELSNGLPRKINKLCDEALLQAFLADRKYVTRDMVFDAARELRLTKKNKED